MPCDEEGHPRTESSNVINNVINLSILLYSACLTLKRMGFDFHENPQLSVWWDAHQKHDKAELKRHETPCVMP